MPTDSTTRSDLQSLLLYDAKKKSASLAFLLWLTLGLFGAHRMYMAKPWLSRLLIAGLVVLPVAFLALRLRSWTLWLAAGIVCAGYVFWILLDAFRIAGWVTSHNVDLAATLSALRARA